MSVEEVLIDRYICDFCGKTRAVERDKPPPMGFHAVIMRVHLSDRKNNPKVRSRAVVYFCDKDCFISGLTFNSYSTEEILNEVPVQAAALRSSERRYTEADIDRVRWGFAYGKVYGKDQ